YGIARTHAARTSIGAWPPCGPGAVGDTMTAGKDRSKARSVTGRLKVALDSMIWEGKPYEEAAKAVGLAARSMRKALERPHVLAYLASGKKQLRASESARILRRLVSLAHQDDNKNAAVAACRAVEHIPEEEGPRHGQAQAPGFVIVLRE